MHLLIGKIIPEIMRFVSGCISLGLVDAQECLSEFIYFLKDLQNHVVLVLMIGNFFNCRSGGVEQTRAGQMALSNNFR